MERTNKGRTYSLRDLLIGILILCVLLALLTPLIQSARETARRTECSQNLKQITFSLLNYHVTFKVFPAGAMHSGTRTVGDPPNDSKLGPSWWYAMLPFVEQSNVPDQIYATQMPGGPVSNQFCARDMIAAGVSYNSNDGITVIPFAKLAPIYMRCPSSPLPAFETKTGPIYLPSYAGITGGCDIDLKSEDYAKTGSVTALLSTRVYRNQTKGTGATPGSIVTSSGMLPPGTHIQLRQCTDGTANCMIVAEQSDWLRDRTPGISARYHGDAGWTVGGTVAGGGWLSGTTRCDPVPTIEAPGGPPTPWGGDCWNLTTVRYPPNLKSVMGSQALPGCSENHGINNPLQSAHPGGFLAGFVDGSTNFFSSSTDLAILLRTAIRDDGQTPTYED